MLKQLLIVTLALAVVSQGTVHADEPARAGDVTTVPDHAALLEHIEALTVGEEVAVATGEGVVAGELVDKDGDDLVVDRPLVEGGAERIAIPPREIQGLRYHSASSRHNGNGAAQAVVVVVVVGLLILLAKALVLPRP